MAATTASAETLFLRHFARSYVSDISFLPAAIADMNRQDVGLADVLHVFRRGRVATGEKTDAEGARWWVEGITCHGREVMVALQVWCDRYHVRVLRVSVTLGESND